MTETTDIERSKFEPFGLDPSILKALDKMQFKEPSPVQAAVIPIILQKKDLIAQAPTGTGKTAACAIPACNSVDTQTTHVQALIIVPTRELALQYSSEAQKIGYYRGVKVFSIYGGEDASLQQAKLKHGVHVLVATPGRLIDFIYSRSIDLSHVNMLILDEADEMLSMGFYDDLEFIIQCLVAPHQTLLFSATMPREIMKIAKLHMKEPVEVNLAHAEGKPSLIEHRFLYCRHDEREASLFKIVAEMQPKQSIIFCHSRHEVEQVCRGLRRHFNDVDFLHVGLTQDIRNIVTRKFRKGIIRYLVATDVVSRGLDFSEVSHVFIYHLGDDPDVYVHRSGRTGRFDKAGIVVTLVTNRELSTLRKIAQKLNQEPTWVGAPPPANPPPPRRRGPPRRR